MKFVSKNGKTYIRHWFRWYYLENMIVFKLDFKAANDDEK